MQFASVALKMALSSILAEMCSATTKLALAALIKDGVSLK
jgi:hypothetical protein